MLITPTASVSPFPHAQLFVEEIDGERMPTYMRWLALAYAPSRGAVARAPYLRSRRARPSLGIQVIGPRGADLRVLAVAAAIEEAFAEMATSRPVPELARLAARTPA